MPQYSRVCMCVLMHHVYLQSIISEWMTKESGGKWTTVRGIIQYQQSGITRVNDAIHTQRYSYEIYRETHQQQLAQRRWCNVQRKHASWISLKQSCSTSAKYHTSWAYSRAEYLGVIKKNVRVSGSLVQKESGWLHTYCTSANADASAAEPHAQCRGVQPSSSLSLRDTSFCKNKTRPTNAGQCPYVYVADICHVVALVL